MNNKMLQLLDLLAKKSIDGSIRWEATPDEYTFRTWIADGAVRVSPGIDDAQRAYFAVSLINKRDEIADEFLAYKGEAGFPQLENIYNIARRTARGADDLLNSMLGHLAKV